MPRSENNIEIRDRRPILIAVGVLLLGLGAFCLILGPLEMYTFSFFSEGGRFAYPGFGFGSFMFGNMVCQVTGYYVIGALAIMLGYGHVRMRRWARPFAETLLWSWLVLGVPLTIVFLFMLLSIKELTLVVAIAIIAVLALSYPIVPVALLRFYRGSHVRRTFESWDAAICQVEFVPMPALVLVFLYSFYMLTLHIPILFNGLVPLFGSWLTGMAGVAILDLLMVCLGILIWGTLEQKAWAWWGAILYFGLLLLSTTITLVGTTYADLLVMARFPAYEIEFLDGIPMQGWHLALFIGLPLIATLAVLAVAKRQDRIAIANEKRAAVGRDSGQ